MQLKNLFADEDAVSPVIGVILMVAITVILAAVIGAFVLGIGGSQEQVPQASFSISYDSDAGEAVITHEGGDAIATGQISLGGAVSVDNSALTWGTTNDDSEWTAGETLTEGSYSQGNEVQIIWSSSSSDSTNIIGSGTAS